MTEAEKAYQYFVIAVPENEEQAKAYFWARKALQSTLPPAERGADAGRQINAQNGDLSERMERSTGYPLLFPRLQKSCEKGRGVLP